MSILRSIVIADYMMRNKIVHLFQRVLFVDIKDKSRIERILVFRTGSIGDNICALPALSVIRTNFPNAIIDLLTNAGKKTSVGLEKLIDPTKFNEVIDYSISEKNILLKKLKNKKYDLFIELPQYDSSAARQIRNQFFAKLIGVKHAFGWKICQTLLFPKFQEKNIQFADERTRLLEILQQNKLDVSSATFIYNDRTETRTKIQHVLSEKGITAKNKNIGIVFGSNVTRNKWPLKNFIQVADHYSSLGYSILLFGGPNDVKDALSFTLTNRTFNFCGILEPLETAEAMKHCSVVITNDTGPMHLSYMVKTPVVALFSSRDLPGKWYPPNDGINKVFRSENIHCSICIKGPCSDNICLKKITPEEVINASNSILDVRN